MNIDSLSSAYTLSFRHDTPIDIAVDDVMSSHSVVDGELISLVSVSAVSVAVALVAVCVLAGSGVSVGSGVAVGVTGVASTSGGSSSLHPRSSWLQTNVPS